MVFKVYKIGGTVPWAGTLYKYGVFRYHDGGVPWIRLTSVEETPGGSGYDIRFGLRDTSGVQVTGSAVFNGMFDIGVQRIWTQVPRGNYALNARSQYWGGSDVWRSWTADLALNDG